jgi:hypothetical protein
LSCPAPANFHSARLLLQAIYIGSHKGIQGVLESFCNQCGADSPYPVYAQMYPVYAWETSEDTPFMRKQVHRLCVENLRNSRRDVDFGGELRQLFRLGLGELSATGPLRSI